jgi:nucleoside 2-deoxyribosyltransferase
MMNISRHVLLAAMTGIPIFPLVGGQLAQATTKPLRQSRTKANTMKIYLAGPLGFSEAGRSHQDGTLIPKIKRLGYEVLNPWTLTDQRKIDAIVGMHYGPARRDAWRKLNVEIGGANRAAIDRSDLMFAVLDGVDVDSGTASEIGYAFAKGKPILGYRGDFRLSADNEGSIVNLQVEYFIRQSGGDIITRLADLADALARLKVPGRKGAI